MRAEHKKNAYHILGIIYRRHFVDFPLAGACGPSWMVWWRARAVPIDVHFSQEVPVFTCFRSRLWGRPAPMRQIKLDRALWGGA